MQCQRCRENCPLLPVTFIEARQHHNALRLCWIDVGHHAQNPVPAHDLRFNIDNDRMAVPDRQIGSQIDMDIDSQHVAHSARA